MELLTIFIMIGMVAVGIEIIRFVLRNELQKRQKILAGCVGIILLAIAGFMIILSIFGII